LLTITSYYDSREDKTLSFDYDTKYRLKNIYFYTSDNCGLLRDSGLYIIDSEMLKNLLMKHGTGFFDKDIFFHLVGKENVFVFPTSGNFISYDKYILKTDIKKKAFFLDRDGTINIDKGYLHKFEEFEFIAGIPELLKNIKDKGYLLIIITNQSGIARGYYETRDVEILHKKINQYLLNKYNFQIDDFYYCPHHAFQTDDLESKKCSCRKPMPELLLKAAQEHNIEFAKSFMVGDKMSDKVLLPELKFIHVKKDLNWSSEIEKLDI